MKLKNFKWMTKESHKNIRTESAGRQIVLDFGKYHLSVIDDGYGSDSNLLEIGVFSACDGVARDMTELPGITEDSDSVKGNLTEAEIDAIILKLYAITGTEPRQV
jgi:hypothetical protein